MGIQAANLKNTALLAKPNWRFHTNKSSLWVRILSSKYRGRPKSSVTLPTCSTTWAGLRKGEATFLNGYKWIARRNSSLSLCFDKWMNKGTLRSLIAGPLNKGEENLRLKDISNFFCWNWDGLSFEFTKSLLLKMKATSLPFSNQGKDRISWYSSPNGEFRLNEA